VRRGILILVGVSCAGVVAELVFNRHWSERSQLIAWVALALVAASAAALNGSPNAATARVIRFGMLLVLGGSLVGVVLHAHANYESGPLDAVYGERWDSMAAGSRWWAAISQRVGPAPVLAPLILSQLAALVHLVTVSRGAGAD
jgi:hypothetical protein